MARPKIIQESALTANSTNTPARNIAKAMHTHYNVVANLDGGTNISGIVQVSDDNSTWIDVGTATTITSTTPVIFPVKTSGQAYQFCRFRRTANTGGTAPTLTATLYYNM